MKPILQALYPTIIFVHSEWKNSIKFIQFITFLILFVLSNGQSEINESLFSSPTSPVAVGLDNLFIIDAGDLGKIKGVPLLTENLNNYIGYFGIYYASFESYLGEKRFQPSEIWKGPLETTSIPGLLPPVYLANNQFIFCPQPNLFRHSVVENYRKVLSIQKPQDPNFHQEYQKTFGHNNLVTGEEKCLTLNIFIQKVPAPQDKLLPVLFFFHGGGSEILSLLAGNLFGAGRFLDHNLVLVLINYRLGGLGSLNLNIDQIPGNAGLYDSLTALKWVKEYIHFFGGDSDKIVIAGQSAGAMMATHLMLSPLAQGLFTGVIALSGCALSPWAITKNHLPLHLKIAEYAGCYDPNSNKTNSDDDEVEDSDKIIHEIRQCLIQLPYEKIVIATHKQSIERENKGLGLVYESKVPSIQHDSLTIERIIAKHPLEVVKAGEQNNVSVLIGATRHDGSFGVTNFYTRYLQFNNLLENKQFLKHQILRKFLEMLGHYASPMFYRTVGSYFMGTARDTEGLIDIATVFAFKDGELQLIEEHTKMNPNCYSYSFEYRGDISLQEMINGKKPIPGGVGHADDIHYLFNMIPLTSDDDKKLSRKLLTYLVNFVHFGNPNGKVPKKKEKWPRFNIEDSPYLIINKEDSVGYFQRDHWANVSIELFKKLY